MAHATYGAPYAGQYGGGLSTSVAAPAAVRSGLRTVPGYAAPIPRFTQVNRAQSINEYPTGRE